MRLSNRLRYSAQVRGLRSRSASHGSAYAASVKLDGLAFSGPGSHLPFLILVCCSVAVWARCSSLGTCPIALDEFCRSSGVVDGCQCSTLEPFRLGSRTLN